MLPDGSTGCASENGKKMTVNFQRQRSHQNSDQALNSDAYKEVVECWESFAEPGSLESDGVLSLLEDRCRAVTNQFLEVF